MPFFALVAVFCFKVTRTEHKSGRSSLGFVGVVHAGVVPEVSFYVNALITLPMRPHGAPNGPPRGTGAQCTQEQPLVVGYGRQLMLEAPQSGHPHQPASRGTR